MDIRSTSSNVDGLFADQAADRGAAGEVARRAGQPADHVKVAGGAQLNVSSNALLRVVQEANLAAAESSVDNVDAAGELVARSTRQMVGSSAQAFAAQANVRAESLLQLLQP